MTITTETWAGADGDAAFTVAPWTKFGSGSASYVRNGAGGIRSVAADFPTDHAFYGQEQSNNAHFAEVHLNSTNFQFITNGGVCVRAVDRNENLSVRHDGTDWGVYANGHGGRVGVFNAALAGTELLRLECGSDCLFYINGILRITVLAADITSYTAFTKTGLQLATGTDTAYNPMVGQYRSGLISDLAADSGAQFGVGRLINGGLIHGGLIGGRLIR